MSLQEAFSTTLRNHRKACRISQEELAHRCDLDRTYISLLERGKRMPTIHVVFKVCYALNIEPNKFILQIETLMNKAI